MTSHKALLKKLLMDILDMNGGNPQLAMFIEMVFMKVSEQQAQAVIDKARDDIKAFDASMSYPAPTWSAGAPAKEKPRVFS